MDHAEQLIKEAERAKAQIYGPPGRFTSEVSQLIHTPASEADEDFLLVGSHIDQTMRQKIERGEYVDFAKLIMKDRIAYEEEKKMELVMKGNQTFWVPAGNQGVSINNFHRWEQAFRVYSNIYSLAHPNRSAELIQYNHIISTVSLSYICDNVYTYDREFRYHMERHPSRSWAIIQQQAWTMFLKGKIRYDNQRGVNHNYHGGGDRNSGGGKAKISEPCRRYNRGLCTNKFCKYEHRCSYCFKFGHTVLNCRRAAADRERRNSDKDKSFSHSPVKNQD